MIIFEVTIIITLLAIMIKIIIKSKLTSHFIVIAIV